MRALRASPAARRKAKELGIDLSTVKGTGPEGAITLSDLEKGAPPAHAPRVHPVARKMAEALGVDLSKVTGTGASGTITKADVE
ncbi:MAG: E3 binding domain-containing protein, partial [Thermoanaerobaculia bacterium]